MAMMDIGLDKNMNLINSLTADCSGNTYGIVDEDYTAGGSNLTCYHYWQDYYYPQIIRESYPVYIQDRAKDKGKQAFEIIKILKDKKFVKLDKVGDFIDLMDELIKIL